jgi:radical SAM superfamily enzyme YgiQ (UPF0313 family)
MSNLGFHSLFHRISLFHGLQAHRFFIERGKEVHSPDVQSPFTGPPAQRVRRAQLREDEGNDLSRYDVILFSVSFELDYVNLLIMLMKADIPFNRDDRGEMHPIIVVGGVAVTANPRILGGVADIIYLGDMEVSIDAMTAALMEHEFRHEISLYHEIARLSGVYVPAVHGVGSVAKAHQERILEPAHSVILTKNTEFSERFLIEVGRGCRNLCRFCMTRCVNNPLRTVPVDRVMHTLQAAAGLTDRVGLIAPVLTDHTELGSIVKGINQAGMRVSFSSLRADDFDEKIGELLEINKQASVTFAPETGSERLRVQMGKGLTDEQLLRAVAVALAHGVRRIRYYFIFGLPGERESDVSAVQSLVRETVGLFGGNRAELHLSFNPFIPKMRTALASQRLYPLEYYECVKEKLKADLLGIDRVRFRFETLKTFYLHYYLSIGDERIGSLLVRCIKSGSFRGFGEEARTLIGH